MIFWYLKTLVFDFFLTELQHYMMFLFLKSIISDNYPLLLVLFNSFPHINYINSFPIHFRKIVITTKISGGFIKFLPLFSENWCNVCRKILIYILWGVIHSSSLFIKYRCSLLNIGGGQIIGAISNFFVKKNCPFSIFQVVPSVS